MGDLENKMLIDAYWPDYSETERERQEEIERQKADMEYDSRGDW